ncbi:GTP-binding protein, partial [Streptomyces sp. SID8455]|nr:GTP-binding protein [Streptomyces sp. SID8455]
DGEEKVRQLTFEDLLREEAGHAHEDHLHAAYESVDFTSDTPMDPRRFMAFLDSRPEGLYRIKGFADFGAGDRDNKYALHAVGRFLRFVPQPWARGEQRLTQLVMIGAGIDAGALRDGLTACRAEPLENPDAARAPADTPDAERSMWGVLRYVRQ